MRQPSCRLAAKPLLALLVAVAVSTPAVAQYTLSAVTERPDAMYEEGEQVRFHVTVELDGEPVESGRVSYVLSEDGLNRSDAVIAELSGGDALIVGSMTQPGFLQCRVTFKTPEGKTLTDIAAAAVSPTEIGLSRPVPDDFDAFWKAQKAELAKVPATAEMVSVDSGAEGVECFDVKVQCVDGVPISGYFASPIDAEPKSLPIILWVQGAGVRSSSKSNAVQGAKRGMLSMDINAHGIINGQPGQFYRDLGAGELENYRHRGRESRDTVYFRGMFLRLVRAIDFLTAQPEWDGRVVAVVGHSQGGGQALAAGGLDDRVTVIGTGVPAICDHSGRAAGRINGWPKIVPMDDQGVPDPTCLKACRYIDAVNFASRVTADAIMSVGFIDTTCPPTTCYAAYNQLQGKKQVINEPKMAHAAPAHVKEAFLNFVLEHVEENSSVAVSATE